MLNLNDLKKAIRTANYRLREFDSNGVAIFTFPYGNAYNWFIDDGVDCKSWDDYKLEMQHIVNQAKAHGYKHCIPVEDNSRYGKKKTHIDWAYAITKDDCKSLSELEAKTNKDYILIVITGYVKTKEVKLG